MIVSVVSAGKISRFAASPGENTGRRLAEEGFLSGVECGQGKCGKCAVRLVAGELVPVRASQDMRKGCEPRYVLACQSVFGTGDVTIEVAAASGGTERKARVQDFPPQEACGEAPAQKRFLELSPPRSGDCQSDLERICRALGRDFKILPQLLGKMPALLRDAAFAITVTIADGEIIDIEKGDSTRQNYGFIVDIGTTTIAVYLADLHAGRMLAAEGLDNPQRAFGADVLSRIAAARDQESLEKLQSALVESIGQGCRRLLAGCGIDAGNVYSMIVAGNTAMSHFFLGADPAALAVAPFVPAFRGRMSVPACDLPLPLARGGKIYVLGNISAHLGSDILGVAMACRPWEEAGYVLALDIGTNGEIMLGSQKGLYACSAAAGPAFEGAHMECGMRAERGAIEKIRLCNDRIELETIGDCAPAGICGSGLIDGVAELLRAGLLDSGGCFAKDDSKPLSSRLRLAENGIREFVVVYKGEYGSSRDIVITQKDIRELQLAKSAIAAGIILLCGHAGISPGDVGSVYLAGAFGNYLDPQNAAAIGLTAGIGAEKIISIGNAAASGAARCLFSLAEMRKSDEIAARVQAVELSGRDDFNEVWLQCLNFSEETVLRPQDVPDF